MKLFLFRIALLILVGVICVGMIGRDKGQIQVQNVAAPAPEPKPKMQLPTPITEKEAQWLISSAPGLIENGDEHQVLVAQLREEDLAYEAANAQNDFALMKKHLRKCEELVGGLLEKNQNFIDLYQNLYDETENPANKDDWRRAVEKFRGDRENLKEVQRHYRQEADRINLTAHPPFRKKGGVWRFSYN